MLVAEKGEILLNKAYGMADRNRHVANTLNTVFNVASFTKQFTAVAVLRLEADGKLSTGDTIDKFLDNVPGDKVGITIHNLLTHTSGLPRGQDGKKNSPTRNDTVAAILKQPLTAKVGEKFRYSNEGYHLLAAVVEKASGQTFLEYVTEKLFKPAGMMHSGLYQDAKWSHFSVAQSYNEWKQVPSFTEWPKVWNYGPGSVVSTASDIFKWFVALNSNRILPGNEKEKLFKPHVGSDEDDTDYGYGWYVEKLKDNSLLIHHGGDNQGYHSEVRWYVRNNRIIIILTNFELLEPDGVAIQKRVIANNLNRIMASEAYKQPPPFTGLSSKNLRQLEGEYELPDGGKFKIWSNGVFLNLGVDGQDAINALAGYEGEAAKKAADANALTEFILTSISKHDQDSIRSRLSKNEVDIFISFLSEQYDEFQKNLGSLKRIQIQGTTAFPWDPDGLRTNVILHFEKGPMDLFLGWRNGKLNDVTTEIGRPFPLIMPLVARTKTEFSTFEFLRSKRTDLTFAANELKLGALIGRKKIGTKTASH
ncbi:MAG TPA: serine hydrolase domain-containing protein [Pyrinomonadaceae bacterium]|nr:serine hydrolase domain-containing protein [Pyrinomonadaceae bacterium]